MDVEAAGASSAGSAALLSEAADLHPGNRAKKVVPVALIERRLLDDLAVDHRADGGVVR